jgi:hypothetical protein
MQSFCLGFRRLLCLLLLSPVIACAEHQELRNATMVATFGPTGLLSVKDNASKTTITLTQDTWSLAIDGVTLRSGNAKPRISLTNASEVIYRYELSGYQIQATYRLRPGWRFVSKQLVVLHAPVEVFTVQRVTPIEVQLRDEVSSAYVPPTYVPQLGETEEQSRKTLPGKDFGVFLRGSEGSGAMLVVQNPFLEVSHSGYSAKVAYSPEMEWRREWGNFVGDTACIGPYRLSGQRLPREMVLEWRLSPATIADDGLDRAEITAFTDCVRAFLVAPAPSPISVEVGWTLNDYQIDVGTPEGRNEYKRIIDSASSLGIRTLLYAPGNSKLAERANSVDAWSWEYVLWLGLGQKIRKGEWDPGKDPLPEDVAEMLSYAKSKHVGLLAYVYPSVPYAKDSSWLVRRAGGDGNLSYATLASRKFQDYLIRNLLAFQRRTGIAGYSFDYTWLNLPGSSSYTQWFGWRRVMEELRREDPGIVIDGRQSYQQYGPWSWLAGSYPHPTGNDEQPESFTPYPDLHFDRVSADRARFVNFWYRNYQFAPTEVIPGYAGHQTERSASLSSNPQVSGPREEATTVYTRYLPRDWDYLGYRYSFISSIATGGWNNVINMIPARDQEEWKHFSATDKAWIHKWLAWTTEHKEYLRNTRTILGEPALGHVDGTSAIIGNHGYLFLFNPNYRRLPAAFVLDSTTGISQGKSFLMREIYPRKGWMVGKPEPAQLFSNSFPIAVAHRLFFSTLRGSMTRHILLRAWRSMANSLQSNMLLASPAPTRRSGFSCRRQRQLRA